MQMQELHNINPTQMMDLLQVVPHPPLLMGEIDLGQEVLIQHHQQPAWEMPENSTVQHVIVHCEMQDNVRVDRTMNSTRRQELLGYGNCVIIPAKMPHRSISEQATIFTLLLLEPSYLAKIAYETVDADRIELIPQFSTHDQLMSTVIVALKKELGACTVGKKLYAESATSLLGVHLLRHYCTHTQTLPTCVQGLPKYKLHQAINYIQEHLSQEISLEAIATHLNMSQYYFCHLFKQSMGVSPYQYVLQQRINKAKQLLKQRQLTITDVALECGFANQTHFTKYFRKLVGTTPKIYREQ